MSKQIACVYVFVSDSSPGKSYQAIQFIDATTSCECPGWVFRKKTLPNGERTCKHTRWIDSGLAEEHAKSFKRYVEIEERSRNRSFASTGSRMPQQQQLRSQRSRVIILD